MVVVLPLPLGSGGCVVSSPVNIYHNFFAEIDQLIKIWGGNKKQREMVDATMFNCPSENMKQFPNTKLKEKNTV